MDGSIYLSIHLSTYLSFFLCFFLSFYLSILIHLSVHLQGYSARLPQFSNLKPSKTQQFCETSSALELDNVKNETILRDFLNFRSCQHQKQAILSDLRLYQTFFNNGKLSAELTAFPVHVSKVLLLPRKIEARSYEMLHLSRKIISKPEDPQPRARNLHLDLLTALMHMSLVLRLPRKMHFRRSSSNVPRLPFWTCYKTLTFFLTFDQVQNPLRLPRKTTSERPKVGRTDFGTCFAPQRRAHFQHLNFQKCSEPISF